MDTLISYDVAVWLGFMDFVLAVIHLVSSHIFFLKYMERIEDHLSEIEMIGVHADYYGDMAWTKSARVVHNNDLDRAGCI